MTKRGGPWRLAHTAGLSGISCLTGLVLVLLVASALGSAWVAADSDPRGDAFARADQARVAQPASLSLGSTVTQVGLDPALTEISTGQRATVRVMVYGVVDLYGFELHMRFNPSVIHIVDTDLPREGVNVTPGDFLTPDYVPQNLCDNVTGKIDVAVMQMGRPPRTGSGRLITVTVEAVGPGDAAVQFYRVLLADANSLSIAHEVLAGTIIATGPTLTPSPSATPTNTPRPSATPTATATPTYSPATATSTATAHPSSTPTATSTSTATATATATATSAGPTAMPTPYFYLDPQVLALSPGGSGQVVIRTSHVDDLCGVEVHLRWDPALVEVVDADSDPSNGVQLLPGDLFEGHLVWSYKWNEADNTTGQLQYSLTLNEGFHCVSGQWSVAIVTFHAIGEGACSLSFFESLMSNPNTGDIRSGCIDGEVRVAPPSPTPTQTPTVTDTPTPTMTPTPSRTSTPSATSTATATGTPTMTATASSTPTTTETPRPTETATPSGGDCPNLIENGGFEVQVDRRAPPWEFVDGAMLKTGLAHGGSSSLWLGGYNGATDAVYQVVQVPTGVISATLSYWWRMETLEIGHPHDYLFAELRGGDGHLVTTLEQHSDGDQAGSWLRSTLDVSSYVSQTIRVHFRASTDGANRTSFYLDDVRLDVCTSGTATPTPTATQGTEHYLRLPIVVKNWAQ